VDSLPGEPAGCPLEGPQGLQWKCGELPQEAQSVEGRRRNGRDQSSSPRRVGTHLQQRSDRKGMINIETQSRLAGRTIIEKAVRFFGPDGLDLEITDRSELSARFEGANGFVGILLESHGRRKRTQVRAVGREYEAKIREFISTL